MEKRESPKTRLVRVFISSTFRDMQAERDRLVKFIFPELRRRCRERQVEFVEVDLRWGVTEDQAERGEVLPICLAEIENCRPYFIGLLGERYGFVPKEIPGELVETQPWLEEHRERSLTELEILHGVLRNPEMAPRAFFYFRDPSYRDRVPTEQVADLISESAEARAKLKFLKDRIRKSGLHLREDYADPKALGELVLEDLWQVIDEEYPAGSEPDPLDREAAEHEAFAEARRKVYIGRQEYFDRLDEHVRRDGPPLVILGESGVGKSALLANWAKRHSEAHLEDFVLLHFTGSTPHSADYVAILRRIFGEIQRHFGVAVKIPTAPGKLRNELPRWLVWASAKLSSLSSALRFILVLDGLNQLDDKDAAPHLGWLPEHFPPNVRLVVSTLSGPSLDAVARRQWPSMRVDGFRLEERKTLIRNYFGQYRKTLSGAHTARIASAPQTANPLYLRVLLDELRILGIHEQIGRRIEHYLAATTADDLYEKILERWEQDYEQDRPGLVRDALSFLWAARRGLAETELLELLGRNGRRIPTFLWTTLRLAAGEAIVARDGLLSFANSYLRTAVRDRYVANKERQRRAHLRLAGYFQRNELSERKVDELPWQLATAGAKKRLIAALTDLSIFARLNTEAKKYELVGYWLRIGLRSEMGPAYTAALDRYECSGLAPEDLAPIVHSVPVFVQLSAGYEAAEPLYRRVLAIEEKLLGPEHPEIATTLSKLAELLRAKGDYPEAEPFDQRSLSVTAKTRGRAFTGKSILDLELHKTPKFIRYGAWGRMLEGDLAGAVAQARKALAVSEKFLGAEHPETSASLRTLSKCLINTGDYSAAEPLCRRALAIDEKLLGPEHPETAATLSVLAALLQTKGDYSAAEPFCRRALEIKQKMLGPEHQTTAETLGQLASLLTDKGDYAEAEPLCRHALELSERAWGPAHPVTARNLCNLATLLVNARGDYAEAEPLCRRLFEIWENARGAGQITPLVLILKLAHLLRKAGRRDESAAFYRRVLYTGRGRAGPRGADAAQSMEKNRSSTARRKKSWAKLRRPDRVTIARFTATSANELAFHTDVPAQNWPEAEAHYRQAIDLFTCAGAELEAWNVELNLQSLFHISGQPVDVMRVEELTRYLEEASNPRAEKGRKLLAEVASSQIE